MTTLRRRDGEGSASEADSELMRLGSAYLDDTLTMSDRDRLEELLERDDHRVSFRQLCRLHAILSFRWRRINQVAPGADPGSDARDRATSGGGRPTDRHGGAGSDRFAAAVAVAVAWAGRWLQRARQPLPLACLIAGVVTLGSLAALARLQIETDHFGAQSRGVPRADSVAFIAGLDNVAWRGGGGAGIVGDFLAAGDGLDVEAGLVELRYFSGARVVIEGPASYEIGGPSSGRLLSGRIVALTQHPRHLPRDAETAPLFTVTTPRGVVDDLGTEFGVDVSRSGSESVHVFDGVVSVVSRERSDDTAAVRLERGNSAEIDGDGSIRRVSFAAARRFVRVLPQARRHEEPLADQPQRRAPVCVGENVERFQPVKARFLRFVVHATSTADEPCLDELEVFATDGRNVARDASATASGTITGYAVHAVMHVNDGLYGNGHSWVGDAPMHGWVQLAFSDTVLIDRVAWSRDRSQPPAFHDRLPTKYVVFTSFDGREWRPVATSGDRLPQGTAAPEPSPTNRTP